MTAEEKPPECYSCGFETKAIKSYRRSREIATANEKSIDGGVKWLCFLCASTLAGNAYEYPDLYPDSNTLKTICYVGNVILDKLKK